MQSGESDKRRAIIKRAMEWLVITEEVMMAAAGRSRSA